MIREVQLYKTRRIARRAKFATAKPRKKLKQAKRRKKTNLWAIYGLKKPLYVRYSGLGGVLWWVLSQYVRQSEFKAYKGKCVDCENRVENWQDADTGHFRSAKSLSTRFLRENLALQRKSCNSPWQGNGNQYAFGKEINRRYGEGTAERLTELSKQTSQPFSKEWYHQQITTYQQALEELSKNVPL